MRWGMTVPRAQNPAALSSPTTTYFLLWFRGGHNMKHIDAPLIVSGVRDTAAGGDATAVVPLARDTSEEGLSSEAVTSHVYLVGVQKCPVSIGEEILAGWLVPPAGILDLHSSQLSPWVFAASHRAPRRCAAYQANEQRTATCFRWWRLLRTKMEHDGRSGYSGPPRGSME
ncbi:hypothetical protein DHEL01_v203568 [Diaporthe helianthi]|uniref:Uncharacterized protein n=1 Tax=Diaporthe helianthi TaxID=158607 RepID=A0A2P5I6B3_DIAHE|nr:hypothetical protein DHEL01_v203568 [Diaporthe helianthi]